VGYTLDSLNPPPPTAREKGRGIGFDERLIVCFAVLGQADIDDAPAFSRTDNGFFTVCRFLLLL
jgi:hypothetical protein